MIGPHQHPHYRPHPLSSTGHLRTQTEHVLAPAILFPTGPKPALWSTPNLHLPVFSAFLLFYPHPTPVLTCPTSIFMPCSKLSFKSYQIKFSKTESLTLSWHFAQEPTVISCCPKKKSTLNPTQSPRSSYICPTCLSNLILHHYPT